MLCAVTADMGRRMKWDTWTDEIRSWGTVRIKTPKTESAFKWSWEWRFYI